MTYTVCGVLNLQGFVIQDKFYVREAGFSGVEDLFLTESQTFNLSPELLRNASKKDRDSVTWLTNNKHGLPLGTLPLEKAIGYEMLESTIREWYAKSKDNERYVLGYKGGIHEKQILKEMKIPHANLEFFGCPKIDYLLPHPPPHHLACNLHREMDFKYHCPMMKTWMYAQWVRDKSREYWY